MFSSDLATASSKSALVLDLCKEIGATTYLSGPLGRDYLECDAFAEAGISLVFHSYTPEPYKQAWPGFEPCMAAIDVLANHERKTAAEIMNRGRRHA